jgi:hypothetical protein
MSRAAEILTEESHIPLVTVVTITAFWCPAASNSGVLVCGIKFEAIGTVKDIKAPRNIRYEPSVRVRCAR